MIFDSLVIIIPVYNEGDNILRTLREIEACVKTPHQNLLIYDFDTDNTVPVVKRFLLGNRVSNVRLVKNLYGKGVLNAILTGFKSAREDDVVLVTMADLSDDLAIVDPMFMKINDGCDIVCGSRYAKGGQHLGGPKFKKTLSRIAGLTLRFLTRIPTHDVSNSFKMYRNSVVNSINIESRGGFEVGMEILIKSYLKGHKIAEIPSVWRDRVAGKSNFKLSKWLPEYLRWYIYALKGSLRKKYPRLKTELKRRSG
jgi:dolichol-phosphate mannosyltransferase